MLYGRASDYGSCMSGVWLLFRAVFTVRVSVSVENGVGIGPKRAVMLRVSVEFCVGVMVSINYRFSIGVRVRFIMVLQLRKLFRLSLS